MGIKRINIGQGEKFAFEKHINEFLVYREDAKLSEVFTVAIPIGKSTHDQIHEDMEQIFVVIQGEGIVRTHDEDGKNTNEFSMKKNDIVLIQLDTYHQIFNTSKSEDLKYVCINAFLEAKKTEFTSMSHATNVVKNYDMKKNILNERPVMVIGAEGFIGKQIITYLESCGKYVWAFDRNEIKGEFNRVLKVQVKKDEEIGKKLKELCDEFKAYPEILIDCTGDNSIKKHSFNLSVEEFRNQVENNLVSVYSHVSDYAKVCKDADISGKVILLGTIGAQMSHREMAGYDSAKGGLEAMVRALSLDYAPYNININTIAVGPIESSPSSNKDAEKTDNLRKLLPYGKYPTVEEVAKYIVDFSRDIPIFVTGQRITIDGGLTSQLRPSFIEKLEEPKMYKVEE